MRLHRTLLWSTQSKSRIRVVENFYSIIYTFGNQQHTISFGTMSLKVTFFTYLRQLVYEYFHPLIKNAHLLHKIAEWPLWWDLQCLYLPLFFNTIYTPMHLTASVKWILFDVKCGFLLVNYILLQIWVIRGPSGDSIR